jgi:hypothetical protein
LEPAVVRGAAGFGARRHVRVRAAVHERALTVAYSIDFAANATGMTVVALIAARLAGHPS